MNVRRITFEYLDVSIDVLPAVVAENAVFRAAFAAYVQPYRLAAQLGRLSEDTARRGLAKAYAEGVITGSPTPALCDYGRADWERWLLEHPDEFETIRAVCEVAENFKDQADGEVPEPPAAA